MDRLDLAVVVGGGQGIGEAVAHYLASHGREVVVADLNLERAESVVQAIQAEGGSARAIYVDVTDPQSVTDLVHATPGARQVAITAGIFDARPSLEADAPTFDRILRVNLIGVFEVARQYAGALAHDGGGAICAIGSIAARMPRVRQAAYSASKAGMRQALRVLGLEVIDKGVRINFVAPGPTESAMMSSLAADHESDLSKGESATFRPPIPDRRVGRPLDVAQAMEFLLSDRSDHIVLHDLHVDGGESLGL